MKLTLPTDSAARKRHPLRKGVFNYFAAILAGVAEVSMDGNDKHNPGQPLHHARGKSSDHADCIDRHLTDVEDIVAYLERNPKQATGENVQMLLTECNQLAWRALALGQELHEKYGGAPLAPAAKLPTVDPLVAFGGAPPAPASNLYANGYKPEVLLPWDENRNAERIGRAEREYKLGQVMPGVRDGGY